VIFAQYLQRLISWRRALMIEVVNPFLPGDHVKGLSIDRIF
jgi:hypothetical protein